MSPARIHAIPRKGGIEYYEESACPDCGQTVFVNRDAPGGVAYGDLESFPRHRCPPKPPPFPVNAGKIALADAEAFRAAVEAAFGKRLVRFPGVFRDKGLPVHFTPEWAPFLGHVKEFSRSDAHRPLDASAAVFQLALPHLKKHFAEATVTTLRKYFFSAEGVAKYERDRAARKDRVHHVIAWTWPIRYH